MEEINIEKIEWQEFEHKHKERSIDWYWTLGFIALVIVVISIWKNSYIFAIFIAVSCVALMISNTKHPRKVDFILDNDGITMGKDKHIWKKIKSFNINKIENEEESKLIIELDKRMLPIYSIPLPTDIKEKVKDTLEKIGIKYDKELNEPITIALMEKIGL